MAQPFQFPAFHAYPPYFTVQPVQETREKQVELWKTLLLDFCKHSKMYVLDLATESHKLFNNTDIKRSLSLEGRKLVCSSLVAQGRAEWISSDQQQVLLLWFTLRQWADKILAVVREYNLKVMTLDDISSGDEVQNTDLQGAHPELVRRALKLLEKGGQLKFFSTAGGEGVKFV